MNILTTDGQLSKANVVVLEDDRQFYPSYLCGNVVRNEVLEMYPELADVFAKVTGLLDDAAMARLNYEVESESQEPKEVAAEFLKQSGLLK